MDPAKISPLGMDNQVAEFLDDNIGEMNVSANLLQLKTHNQFILDHYDDDFHPDYPDVVLPAGTKPVPGVNYRTDAEERVHEEVKKMSKKLDTLVADKKDADIKEKYGKTDE